MRALIVLTLLLPLASGATDPAGDPPHPDFDLLSVQFSETAEHIAFTLTVAGTIREPVQQLQEFEIRFRTLDGASYDPGQPMVGVVHTVRMGMWSTYQIVRLQSGYALPDQPDHGGPTATWSIPKAYLEVPGVRRPLAGDWLDNVQVRAMDFGFEADAVTLPNIRLQVDDDGGPSLHLRRDGTLTPQAPRDERPAAAAAAAGWHGAATWTSAELAEPLALTGLGAHLWISATTTSPVVSNEDFRVFVYDLAPDGTRTWVATREEERTDAQDSFTFLFLIPGVPQRMPFALVPSGTATEIPVGHRVEVVALVGGFFGFDSGPVLILHDGVEHPSALKAG